MQTKATVGVQDFVYAVMTPGTDTIGGSPQYGAVRAIPGIRNLTFNGNASVVQSFGDNGSFDSSESMGEMTVDLELHDIPFQDRAYLLGNIYQNGQLVEGKDDVSPFVAIGAKITLSGGAERYFWLPKVLFTKPNVSAQTREASVSFQYATMSGAVMNLVANSNYRHNVRTDDANAPATMLANYFNQPVFALDADLGNLAVTIAKGTNGDTGKVILTFAKTGGGNFTLASDTVGAQNILIGNGTGIVAGAFTTPSGTPAATQVIKFTPTVAFTGLVAAGVKGVLDNHGVTVTANNVALNYP